MGNAPSKTLPQPDAFNSVHSCHSGERFLGDGTDAVPSVRTGRRVNLCMEVGGAPARGRAQTTAVLLAEGGEINEFVGGVAIKRYARMERKPTELMVMGGGIIAVYAKVLDGRQPTWRVYGVKPKFEGQERSVGEEFQKQYDRGPLYAWATITRSKNNPFRNNMVTMIAKGGESDGTSYSTDQVAGPLGPQVVVWREESPAVAVQEDSFAASSKRPTWRIKIAPGIDPCLVICLVAIMADQKQAIENKENACNMKHCCNGCIEILGHFFEILGSFPF